MYISIYIYVHICIYKYMYTYTHALRIYAYIYIRMHTYMYVHMYIIHSNYLRSNFVIVESFEILERCIDQVCLCVLANQVRKYLQRTKNQYHNTSQNQKINITIHSRTKNQYHNTFQHHKRNESQKRMSVFPSSLIKPGNICREPKRKNQKRI